MTHKPPQRVHLIIVLTLMACQIALGDPIQVVDDLYSVESPGQVIPSLPKIPSKRQIIYQATDARYKFCHHPCLMHFQNRIYCMWSNGRIHEDETGQRLLIAHSKTGRNWEIPRPMFTGMEDKIFVASGLFEFDGKLTAFFTITGGKNFHPDTALHYSQSSDGQQWSQPVRITSGFFINPPVRLTPNRLLLGGEVVTDDERMVRRAKILIHDGKDLNVGWQEVFLQEGDLSRIGYCEPNFIVREQDVLMLLRNYTGTLLAATSSNGGQAWSAVFKTVIPDSTARFATGQLPDGQRYLINNALYARFDRRALILSLSSDHGKTLNRAFVLRDEPAVKRFDGKHKMDGWQYPHAHVWKRRLFVVHSVNKEDVEVSTIRLQQLRPSTYRPENNLP